MTVDSETRVETPGAGRSATKPSPAPLRRVTVSGTIASRYEVRARVGVGGTSIVYEAFDRDLVRAVAVKLLKHDDLEREALLEDMARLLREGQVLARLAHPNIVTVYDAGRYRRGDLTGEIVDEVPRAGIFIVEELVVGRTLSGWRRSTSPSWREALDVMLAAGRGLAAAHAAGLVHRDFKPGNVMLGDDGRVRVLDFGLASLVGATTEQDGHAGVSPEPLDDAVSISLTRTGTVMGTPMYMAPEQHEGTPADERSDQYGFCAAFYAVLTGQRPFVGESLAEIYRAKLTEKIGWPQAMPSRLRRIVERGLSPKSDDRYPSMDALLAEIAELRHRGRRQVTMVGAAGLGAATLFYATAFVVDRSSCHDGDDTVVEAWGSDARASVESAFAASGTSFADDAWAGVTSRLDGFANEWTEVHRSVCDTQSAEATAMTHDLRVDCLEDGAAAFVELVDLLAHADAGVVEKAVAAASKLPDPRRCLADVSDNEPALPVDPRLASEVRRVRAELQRIEMLQNLGRWKEARAVAVTALAEALELEFPPLEAEARVRLGTLQAHLGDFEVAYEGLTQAAWLAESLKHDRAALVAQIALINLLGTQMGRHDEALTWVRYAEASLTRRPNPRRQMSVLQAKGRTLARMGRYQEALETFQEFGAVLAKSDETNPYWEAAWNAAMGYALNNLGELGRAREHAQRTLDAALEMYGEHHPNVANARRGLGTILMDHGDLAGSQRELEQAMAIMERTIGPNAHGMVALVDSLGNAISLQGGRDEASAYHTRAMAIAERSVGRRHQSYIFPLMNLANDKMGSRELETARQRFIEAVELLEEIEHPGLAGGLTGLASTLGEMGRYAEAEPLQARAVEKMMALHGPEHPATMNAINNLAEAKMGLDKCDKAIELGRQALTGLERINGVYHPHVSSPLMIIGECQHRSGRLDSAIAHFERALRIRERGGDPFRLSQSQFFLARALWDAGRGRQALRQARRARTALEDNPDLEHGELAEIVAWLDRRTG